MQSYRQARREQHAFAICRRGEGCRSGEGLSNLSVKTSSGSVMRWNWYRRKATAASVWRRCLDKDGNPLEEAPGGGWEVRARLPEGVDG